MLVQDLVWPLVLVRLVKLRKPLVLQVKKEAVPHYLVRLQVCWISLRLKLNSLKILFIPPLNVVVLKVLLKLHRKLHRT